ncbi:MAG: right-handed parallel beta-helix repeat-containing protein [bacterium]
MEKKKLVFIAVVVLFFSITGILQADTFIVTNTDDSGVGSLRQAMEDADSHTGADTIVFQIPEGVEGYDSEAGIWEIKPESPLPYMDSDSTFIDGTTQAAFIGGDPNDKGPEIVINGGNVGSFSGISISGSYNTISHLVINRFNSSQISIYGTYNLVIGCFLSTDYKGEKRYQAQDYGIFLGVGSAFNSIGEMGRGNLISGNIHHGITVRDSHYNEIIGNIIGLNRTGEDTLSNKICGIEMSHGCMSNTIGPGNVISGNKSCGISISSSGSDSTIIVGNYIGTDVSGTVRMNSQRMGIYIFNKVQHTMIGGSNAGERNVICGHEYSGIEITGDSTNNNIIKGNYIGINAAGTDTIGNGRGIWLLDGAQYNQVGPGNIISGNDGNGIEIEDEGTESNTVIGNIIGPDPEGNMSWGNKSDGVRIEGKASKNIIGGNLAEMRNIISGNKQDGIKIYGVSTDSNYIWGNYIGTDVSGTSPVPNENYGIGVMYGSKGNMIGGEGEGKGNLISGNDNAGICLYGENTENNKIINNLIGTDVTGELPLKNGNDGVSIGGGPKSNRIGPYNIIAFNEWHGVDIWGEESTGNTITHNSIHSNGYVGINNTNGGNTELEPPEITSISSVSGTAVPNTLVEIFSGPDDEGKIFEDSVRADGSGNFYWPDSPQGPWVTATATDASGNTSEFSQPVLLGNIIVTTTADTGEGSLRSAIELANQSSGQDSIHFNIPTSDEGFNGTVWIIRPQSQLPSLDEGVVIDGFTQTNNQGDVNEAGPEIVLNGRDVEEYTNGFNIYSSENIITGLVINGFNGSGIYIGTSNARNNLISSNYIGTTSTGDDTLGNGDGIYLSQEVSHTLIGGYEPGSRNLISGNHDDGIVITGDSNTVVNNYIGLDVTGIRRVANEGDGIFIYAGAQNNQIGGADEFEKNIISGNKRNGIYISGEATNYNKIQGNYIGLNAAGDDTISNNSGINISSNHNLIGGVAETEGNIISGNEGYGIYFYSADSNEVFGNIVGTTIDIDTLGGNGASGIYLYNSSCNSIGGEDMDHRNIIVNNKYKGIVLTGSSSVYNMISGNFIGTDTQEEKDLSNGAEGIYIGSGASDNRVGPFNVIAFNYKEGVIVRNSNTIGNTITRNSIFSNKEMGINLESESNQNIDKPVIQVNGNVSGTAPALSTVEIFSGPDDEGKDFLGSAEADETGNFIWEGTPSGSYVTATATDTAGNTSEFSGAWLLEDIVVTTTADTGQGSLRRAINQSNSTVQSDTIWFNIPESDENFDGTVWRIAPQTALPELTGGGTIIYGVSQKDNQRDTNTEGPEILLDGSEITEYCHGLEISSSHNEICGLVVSGFSGNGLRLDRDEAVYNHIYSNYIGTTPTGNDTLRNGIGIQILYDSDRNRIGGAGPDSMNVVSGNYGNGIYIHGADSNVVIGNIIGLSASGDKALENGSGGIEIGYGSTYNRIGGSSVRERNIISGNHFNGVNIEDEGTDYNKVMGNFIGLGSDGVTDLGNGYRGIEIKAGASNNTIGGNAYTERNCISGNEREGIRIYSENTTHNHILGNYIGVDSSGVVGVGNGYSGIQLSYKTSHNIIGKSNIISGNNSNGIFIYDTETDSNTVIGNWVGLDYTGQDTIPNKSNGIYISGDASYNIIGRPDNEDRNIVAGNGSYGIYLRDDSTAHNIIQNNYCGTDTSGTFSLGNESLGIYVSGMNNVIRNNVVCANSYGVYVYKSLGGNLMYNNYIGVGADGISALPNSGGGFYIAKAVSDTIGPGNKIWNNIGWGVLLSGTDVQKITVIQNSISGNTLGGISLIDSANAGIAAPVITGMDPLTGTAAPDALVEVFSDTSDQGGFFEGYTYADGSGNWTYSGSLTGPKITATATDTAGNTSEFSNSMKTSVKQILDSQIPQEFFLTQNYPNPFNPVTTIKFGVQKACQVILKIYNIRGQEITTVTDKFYQTGEYEVKVDASRLSSGIYIYKIQMANFVDIKKMVLLE